MSLKLEIVTPNGKIFSGNVKKVTFPGIDGEFGVLPGHTPLITTLKAGIIEINAENEHDVVAIDWGYVDIKDDNINVLVDKAILVDGDDESEIKKALDEANELLKSVEDSNIAYAYTESKLESAAKLKI